ncbi:MAG: restriction endonuclease subunit S [Gemmatimonadaceae bacterium]
MTAWKTIALGDLTESVEYGVTASASQRPVGPKFLRITDIQDGAVNWDSVPWCECDARSASDAQLKPGDIVFTRTGATTGKSFLIRDCPRQTVFASYLIRVRLGHTAEPSFVSRFFQTPSYWAQITKSARGLAQPGVNATTLKALRVPLPSLPEQRRIADVLDRADALRAKRRATLAQLDTLTQSIFLDMFGDPATNPKGWPVAPLAEMCSLSGEYGAGVASMEYDSNLPRYVRITDVTEGGELAAEKVSPSGDARDWERYLLDAGDVLFARSGATVGKTYIHRPIHGDCVFAGYMIRFRPKADKLSAEYLFEFTRSAAYRSWVSVRQRVVAQPNINAQQYGRELLIPRPPVSLQHEFASRASGVSSLKSAYRASLLELDTLFSSLQHRAFRGEL